MRYRYLDDLRRRISVFAIFSYGIGNPPQCPSCGCPQFLDTFFHCQLALFFNVTISSFIFCLRLHSSLSSFAKLVSILNDFPLICDPCYAHRILGSPGGEANIASRYKEMYGVM